MKQYPNHDADDVISSSFQINITVQCVDQETIDRMTTKIERMLRQQAVTVLIAKNETYSRRLDLTCAIIYPNPAKQKLVIRNIRSKYIPSCFPEGTRIERKTLAVSAAPIEPFDIPAFWKMHSIWSQPPWTMVYAGPGAQAGRVERREGPKLDLIRNSSSCFAEMIFIFLFDCSAGSGLPAHESSGVRRAVPCAHVATGGGSGGSGVAASAVLPAMSTPAAMTAPPAGSSLLTGPGPSCRTGLLQPPLPPPAASGGVYAAAAESRLVSPATGGTDSSTAAAAAATTAALPPAGAVAVSRSSAAAATASASVADVPPHHFHPPATGADAAWAAAAGRPSGSEVRVPFRSSISVAD